MKNISANIDIILLSIIIAIPGSGIFSNLLFLLSVLLTFYRIINFNNYVFNAIGVLLFTMILCIIYNDRYSFNDPFFYSCLKIIFILLMFIYLIGASNKIMNYDFSEIYWFVCLLYYLSIVNIVIFIFEDFLVLSNEKGIAGQSLLLLAILKSLIKKKINYIDISIVFSLIFFIGAFRSVIFAFFTILLLFKFERKFIIYLLVLGLLFFGFLDILFDKIGGLSYAIDGGNVVGRYAAAAMAAKVYEDNIYYGYGVGQYHIMYEYFYPTSPVDGIDYSGFAFAENFFEIGYLTILLYSL